MNAVSMNEPLAMVLQKDPEKPVAYACGTCGVLYTGEVFGGGDGGIEGAKRAAAEHCLPKKCECGNDKQSGYILCRACLTIKEKEREQKRFDNAAQKLKIEDYDGPVYWENGPSGSMGDGYFSSIEDLLDTCEEESLDLPHHVWASKPIPFRIDADDSIERALSDHHEDAYDSLSSPSIKELQTVLDEWCGKQKIESWEPDYSRAIVLAQGD